MVSQYQITMFVYCCFNAAMQACLPCKPAGCSVDIRILTLVVVLLSPNNVNLCWGALYIHVSID